jgi:type III restriction enzyme
MKMDGEEFKNHLFINSNGKFNAKLNTWETPVLMKELARPKVIGWLRNLPRKEWLCVPYKMAGDDKRFFPDFIIFRELEGRIVIDILDPHSTHLPDAVPKAKGLAEYARQHGDHYERIEFIIINSKGEIKRLDLNDESIREKVLRVESKAHLEQLFEDWG